MNITLRQLHVFQSVAATRNFSRAGDVVGLTQPAVSRCITELEAQLGLKLLNRTTREVTLTDAGQRLSARLPRVLEELENTLLDVRELATERRGRVRVASSPTLSANLMPDCIADCQRTLPGLELVLLDRIQSAVLASVLSGEVDFGVVIDPSEREALHCETILTEPFCLACPPDHRLAGKRQVRWTDLQGEALVLLDHDSGSRRLIDRALAEHGVTCTVAQEVGHPTTLPHAGRRPGHLGDPHPGAPARRPDTAGGAPPGAARGPRDHAGTPEAPRALARGTGGLGPGENGGGAAGRAVAGQEIGMKAASGAG